MAKRDVELIIKAKDEATQAIESVTKAIRSLGKEQAAAGTTVDTFSTRLSQLNTAFVNLEKQVSGFTSLAKATSAFTRASKEVDKLSAREAALVQQQTQLAASTEKSAAAVQQFAQSQGKIAADLEREKQALTTTTAARNQYAAELQQAKAAVRDFTTEGKQLEKGLVSQTKALASAEASFAKLSARTAGLDQASAAQNASVAKAAAALETKKRALTDLTAKQEANRTATLQAVAAEVQLANAFETAKAAVTNQAAVVRGLEASQKALGAAERKAATEERGLQVATAGTVTALERLKAEVASAEAVLSTESAALAKVTAEQQKLASAGVGGLVRAMQTQKSVVSDSVSTWRSAREAVNAYVTATNFIGPRTQAAAQDFEKLRASSALAKQEMLLQATALSQIKSTLEGARNGTLSLAQAQERFASIQTQLAASLGKVRGESAAAAASLESVAKATGTAATQQQRLSAGAKSSGDSMQRAGAQTSSFSQELAKLGGQTRQALSFMQRLRAQVLSLGSAYIGFFGIARGINGVIDATKLLQAAQTRLNVIFNGAGGAAKAAQEMDKLRRMADRLGLNFGTLADQFTIFASSTQGTNINMDKTRQIFIAVSEAARVLNLSVEDQQGVFKALGQIASKGTLQMEELRGQLGDRMPGALKLMADGLKITVKELQNQTKQGKISSDALIPFAEEITRLYGPGLSAALSTTAAKMGMLGQAAFSALVRIGQSGFIEAFNSFIDKITEWFRSADADAFFNHLGTLLGTATDLLSVLVDHINITTTVLVALFSMKVGGALLAGILRLSSSLVSVATNAVTAGTAMTAMAGRAAGASAAIVTLRTEMMLLLGSTGLGLAAAAIGVAISLWVTHVDDATAAINVHKKIIDELKNTYDVLGNKTADFAKNLRFANIVTMTANVEAMRQVLSNSISALQGFGAELRAMFPEGFEAKVKNDSLAVIGFIDDLAAGKATINETRDALTEIFKGSDNQELKDQITAIIEAIDGPGGAREATENFGEAQLALKNIHKPFREQIDALEEYRANLIATTGSTDGLKASTEKYGDTATKAGTKADQAFERAIKRADNLDGVIRRATEGFDTFSKKADANGKQINRNIKDVDAAGNSHVRVLGQEKQAFDESAAASDGVTQSVGETTRALGQSNDQAVQVSGSMKNIKTIHQELSVSAQESAAALTTGAQESAVAQDKVTQSFHNAAEAAAAQGQITKEVNAANIQSAADYKAQLDAAAAAYAKMGTDFENTPDPFGALTKSAQDFNAETNKVADSVSGLPDALRAQFNSVAEAVRALVADLKAQLAALQAAIEAAKAAASAPLPGGKPSGQGGIGHAARGGLQTGPGSGTSDSFLSLLSNGEYVIKAAAVKKYGAGLFNRLNRMMMPKFAMGGPVSIPVDVLPQFLEGGSMHSATKTRPTRVVNLTISGETFSGLIAPEEVASKLLAFGRKKQIRSAGRAPRWIGRKA